MNSIIDSVMASRRLKIFTAYYAMIYVVVNLVLNLVASAVPFFGDGVGRIVFKLISLVIQAPFIYGLVRGIINKNYNATAELGAFTEVKNFGTYGVYISVNLVYAIIGMLIEPLGQTTGTLYTVGSILYVVYTLFQFVLNLFLVKLYFDSIDNGRVSFTATLKGCAKLLKNKPMKFVAAEVFMLIAGLAVTVISSMIAGLLPEHISVSVILSCINSVQYGFIILSWPVYYLYYRWAFEE
jgi:hypothetical protein